MHTSPLSKVRGEAARALDKRKGANVMPVEWWYLCFFALGICCGWAAVKGLDA